MKKGIMVKRAGFACVSAETDDEALKEAMELKENDFKWEPLKHCVTSAEIFKTVGAGQAPAAIEDESPDSRRDSNELAGGYLLLPVRAELTDEEYDAINEGDDAPLMYAAVSRDSLKRYLGEGTTDEGLEYWLCIESTREDTDDAYGFALLDDGVAFTWDEHRDEPFEVVGIDSFQAMQAAMDFISGKMQEQGHFEASKWLDCLFDL